MGTSNALGNLSFEPLERRLVLSAPPSVFSLGMPDPTAFSAGRPTTLVAHATDDVGVRAVTFFVDVNADNEWTPGVDRHLGQLFAPDAGTSDRYTFTFTADWSTPGQGVRIRFAANAVDTEGQWPVNAFTVETDIYQRLTIAQFLAQPLGGNQARLTATVVSPFGASSAGMQGVTFWYDANGNNAWDPGVDVDLGYTESASGAQLRDFVIVANISPGWTHFSASARDLRSSADRFGLPLAAVLRQTAATPPLIAAGTLYPANWPITTIVISSDAVRINSFWSTTGVTAYTLFRDVNLNGVWDYTVDQPLREVVYSTPTTAESTTVTIDRSWGSGLMSFGAVIRTDPGLGDDAWSPVRSSQFITNFQAWVLPTAQMSYTVARNQSISIDFIARDDEAVRTAFAFIDANGDNRLGPSDFGLTQIVPVAGFNSARATFRLTIDATFGTGTFNIGFYAADYVQAAGPPTFATLVVTP